MSNVVQMHPETHRAERLMDAASDGGFEVYVHWNKRGNTLLFRLRDDVLPTASGSAAAVEMSYRFKTNTDFRETIEHYTIQSGASVHNVDELPWSFQAAEA